MMIILFLTIRLFSSHVSGELEGKIPVISSDHQLFKDVGKSQIEPIVSRHSKVNTPTGFSYSIDDDSHHFRREYRDEEGIVRGMYGYKTPLGVMRLVRYVSDNNGFRASVASNEPGIGNLNPSHVIMEKLQPEVMHFDDPLDNTFRINNQGLHQLESSTRQIARDSASARGYVKNKQPYNTEANEPMRYNPLRGQQADPRYGGLGNQRISPHNIQLQTLEKSSSFSLDNANFQFNVPNENVQLYSHFKGTTRLNNIGFGYDYGRSPPAPGTRGGTISSSKDFLKNFYFPVSNYNLNRRNQNLPRVSLLKCRGHCREGSNSRDIFYSGKNRGTSAFIQKLQGGNDESERLKHIGSLLSQTRIPVGTHEARKDLFMQNPQELDNSSVIHLIFAKKLLELNGLDGVLPPYLLPNNILPRPDAGPKQSDYVLQRFFPKTGTRWRIPGDTHCGEQFLQPEEYSVTSRSPQSNLKPNSFSENFVPKFHEHLHTHQSENKVTNDKEAINITETLGSTYSNFSETANLAEINPGSVETDTNLLDRKQYVPQDFSDLHTSTHLKTEEQALIGNSSNGVPNEGHDPKYLNDSDNFNESKMPIQTNLTGGKYSTESSKTNLLNSSVTYLEKHPTAITDLEIVHLQSKPSKNNQEVGSKEIIRGKYSPIMSSTGANSSISTAYNLSSHLNDKSRLQNDWEEDSHRVVVLKPLRYPAVISTLPEYLQVPPLSDAELGMRRFFRIPGPQQPLYDSRGVLIKPENVPVHLHRFTPMRGSSLSSKSAPWRFAIPKPVPPTSVVIPPKPPVL